MEKRKKQKRSLTLTLLVLALILCYGCVRVYYRLTDDFCLANMTYPLPHHPEWEIPPLSPSKEALLKNILEQEFYYLDKGAQCYAFVSQDQKWVIKFFKFKHLKPSFWLHWLPPLPFLDNYRTEKIAQKKKRLNNVFNAHKLAYDVYREESGLLYLHLNTTEFFNRYVRVVDKMGRKWRLDLNSLVFVVQEKATKFRNEMNGILSRGDIDLAKQRIGQIFDLYLKQYRMGIYDWGHGVMHNNGFVGNKPIHFDVEKLLIDEKMKQKKYFIENLEKMAVKLDRWIFNQFPQYHRELVQEIGIKCRDSSIGENNEK